MCACRHRTFGASTISDQTRVMGVEFREGNEETVATSGEDLSRFTFVHLVVDAPTVPEQIQDKRKRIRS